MRRIIRIVALAEYRADRIVSGVAAMNCTPDQKAVHGRTPYGITLDSHVFVAGVFVVILCALFARGITRRDFGGFCSSLRKCRLASGSGTPASVQLPSVVNDCWLFCVLSHAVMNSGVSP